VPPFAGYPVGALEQLAVNGEATTASSTQDHRKNGTRATGSPVDAPPASGLCFDSINQMAHRAQGVVVVSRIGLTYPGQYLAVGIEGGSLDLGATEINADLDQAADSSDGSDRSSTVFSNTGLRHTRLT